MLKASCVLLLNEKGEVLSVSRKDDPNAFGLPGGKLDPEETFEQAAIRETKEETGLDIFDLEYAFSRPCLGEKDYYTVTFIAKYDPNQTIQPASPNETGVVKWLEPKVLLEGSFAEYNKTLFEYLQINV